LIPVRAKTNPPTINITNITLFVVFILKSPSWLKGTTTCIYKTMIIVTFL
ncbi:uncharacterized protein METZ01_LOCUS453388, partial [marine metagenome]